MNIWFLKKNVKKAILFLLFLTIVSPINAQAQEGDYNFSSPTWLVQNPCLASVAQGMDKTWWTKMTQEDVRLDPVITRWQQQMTQQMDAISNAIAKNPETWLTPQNICVVYYMVSNQPPMTPPPAYLSGQEMREKLAEFGHTVGEAVEKVDTSSVDDVAIAGTGPAAPNANLTPNSSIVIPPISSPSISPPSVSVPTVPVPSVPSDFSPSAHAGVSDPTLTF